MRVTVALACAVPPAPLQLSVNVVALANAPVPSLPAVAFVPLQPPDAVHDVALVEVQVRELLPPLATLVGDAESVTVGAGVVLVTDTEVLACAVPPAPVQLSANVVLAVSAPVLAFPETAFVPLQPPDAVQDVALVDDQVNVLLEPLLTVVGEADSATVGGGGVGFVTATVTLAWAEPRYPVHVMVKVEVEFNAAVRRLPDVAFEPLHAPDAVHVDARLLDQLKTLVPPRLTETGLALIVTLGARLFVAASALPTCPSTKTASASGANRSVVFMAAIIG